jgi:hypothetical protein
MHCDLLFFFYFADIRIRINNGLFEFLSVSGNFILCGDNKKQIQSNDNVQVMRFMYNYLFSICFLCHINWLNKHIFLR